MKIPDLIALDFDGTIGNTILHTYKAMCRIFADYHKVPPSFSDYIDNFGIKGALVFYSEKGINLPYDELYRLYLKYLMELHSKTRAGFFPDAPQSFIEIAKRNIRVGIVSAQIQEFVRSCLEDLTKPQMDSLGFVVTAVRHKPTALLELRNTLPCNGGTSWYVGDTTRDMTDAKEAGYVPIGITRGFSDMVALCQAGAEHYIDDMSGLHALLDKCED